MMLKKKSEIFLSTKKWRQSGRDYNFCGDYKFRAHCIYDHYYSLFYILYMVKWTGIINLMFYCFHRFVADVKLSFTVPKTQTCNSGLLGTLSQMLASYWPSLRINYWTFLGIYKARFWKGIWPLMILYTFCLVSSVMVTRDEFAKGPAFTQTHLIPVCTSWYSFLV